MLIETMFPWPASLGHGQRCGLVLGKSQREASD